MKIEKQKRKQKSEKNNQEKANQRKSKSNRVAQGPWAERKAMQ